MEDVFADASLLQSQAENLGFLIAEVE